MLSRQFIIFSIFLAALYLKNAAAQSEVELVIIPKGNVTKPLGKSFAITCLLIPETAKDSIGNIRWLDRNGMLIGDSVRVYTRPSSIKGFGKSLYNKVTQEDDAGEYTCTAEHPGHSPLVAKTWVTLFQDISFDDAPTRQTVILGTSGKIKCAVSGNPPPEVEWSRDDVSISTGGRYKVETDGLVIEEITPEDEGEYVCQATVADTSSMLDRQIRVEVQSEPKFQEGGQPKDTRGLEEKTVSMDCRVDGRPGPDVKWVFIPTGDDVTKMEDEEKTRRHLVDPLTGTMTINDLKKRDEGEYKCTAENAAGKLEASAKLFVVEKPRFDVVSNVTISEGDSATIECTVRGDPSPTLQYTREGNALPITKDSDTRLVLTENDKVLTLTVNSVNRDDDGLYFCQANNEAGTVIQASHITVKFKPTFRHTPMHTAKTWMGNPEAVNLTCIAESIPNATIRWEKRLIGSPNGLISMPLDAGSQNVVIEQRGPSSSLLVTAANNDVFGEFECIASNELGESRHTITLFQATVPGPVISVEFPIITATTITFKIHTPDEPNNLELEAFEVYYIEIPGGSFSSAQSRSWPIGVAYTLDGLEPGRRYAFRFHARNRLGVGAPSRDFELTMPDIGPPRPPGYLPAGNETVNEANRYRLQWEEPADNGARIMDYHIRYWKNGQNKDDARVAVVKAPSGHHVLTGLDGSTLYHVEMSARNERGFSAPLNFTFTTGFAQRPYHRAPIDDVQISTPVIVGIAIAAALLLALIIDLTCFFTRKMGLTAWVVQRFCGKSEKLKNGDVERVRIEETDVAREEKEPLTTPKVTATFVKTTTTFKEEKEPEDKPSPQ